MANKSSFCHVFLSFKGETRDTFTCFLYEALKAEGFKTFMDKVAIREGDEVDLRIQQGIQDSMSAIVVLSKNYAFSTWCLDELLLILGRKNTSRYLIIPIFHQVKAADVRHQLGNYGAALEKHKNKIRHNDDKVKLWRQALQQVGNILGQHVEGEQSVFIQKFVKLFREEFSAKFKEFHVPLPKNQVLQRNYPSTSSTHEVPKRDKVVLYTTEADRLSGEYFTIKWILMKGNVELIERNCSREPRYITELENLVGNSTRVIKFPTLIVNGKDLSGEEEVEGLDGIRSAVLSLVTHMRSSKETMNNLMKNLTNMSGRSWFNYY